MLKSLCTFVRTLSFSYQCHYPCNCSCAFIYAVRITDEIEIAGSERNDRSYKYGKLQKKHQAYQIIIRQFYIITCTWHGNETRYFIKYSSKQCCKKLTFFAPPSQLSWYNKCAEIWILKLKGDCNIESAWCALSRAHRAVNGRK